MENQSSSLQIDDIYECFVCRISPSQDQFFFFFFAGQKTFCSTKSQEITMCTIIPYGCGVPLNL